MSSSCLKPTLWSRLMRASFSLLRTLVFAFGLCLHSGSATAEFPDIDRVVQAEILPGWREDDGRHFAGIRLRLAPGWKTYWRVPGEGGIPPHFNLSGSENIATFQAHMPSPEVFHDQGLTSIGYTGDVVFPMEFQTKSPNAPIHLRGVLKIGVCEAVCIPADVPLEAVLAAPGQSSPSVKSAMTQVPDRVRTQPRCELSPENGALRLSLSIPLSEMQGEYPVIETSNREVWISTSQVWREDGRLHAIADLYPPQGAPYVFDRSGLRVTVLSKSGGVELIGCARN